jgi:hypothetical protein
MFSTLASKLRRLEAVFACPKTDFHLPGGIRSKNQAVLKVFRRQTCEENEILVKD